MHSTFGGHYKDIAVVGASAGGLKPLQALVAGLPPTYTGCLFVVLHIPPEGPDLLTRILARSAHLPVLSPVDGQPVEPGHIYVASPNHHLLLEDNRVRVRVGPRENNHRPSVDVLFRSAARTYGPRVVGTVLSGRLDDGSAGAFAIKDRHGTVIVQDPSEADYADMPRNVAETVKVDHVLPVADIGPMLYSLSREPAKRGAKPLSDKWDVEFEIAMGVNGLANEVMALGKHSPYSCPECRGVLVAIQEGHLARFRCHTGHAFTLKQLLHAASKNNEGAIITALRSVEEVEMLLVHTQRHLRLRGKRPVSALMQNMIDGVKRQSSLLKEAASLNQVFVEPEPPPSSSEGEN